ncbi:hypothetical protein AA984_28610 [Brevibacillus formosus]|uniref:Uncharacterized protein n=2 Tax=Brevibacillus formosus TaxID=54913 RepID=A0A837KHN2_9BACL|nr:hypothetical protein AA984_28610 [Brevibacillus formosus]PSJ94948.1 hypothetical protein C7R91_16830 [Brevibacillus formosus]
MMMFRNIQGILTVFSFVLLFTFLIQPIPASACSCARPPDPLTAKDRSAAVFTGKVLQVNERTDWLRWLPFWDKPERGGFDVIFEVQSTWKGVDQTQVQIVTSGLGGACGIPFQPGQEYLVYASYWELNELETNICTRTVMKSDAREDLLALGPGAMPISSANLVWNDYVFTGTVVITSAGIFLYLFWFQTKRRR